MNNRLAPKQLQTATPWGSRNALLQCFGRFLLPSVAHKTPSPTKCVATPVLDSLNESCGSVNDGHSRPAARKSVMLDSEFCGAKISGHRAHTVLCSPQFTWQCWPPPSRQQDESLWHLRFFFWRCSQAWHGTVPVGILDRDHETVDDPRKPCAVPPSMA